VHAGTVPIALRGKEGGRVRGKKDLTRKTNCKSRKGDGERMGVRAFVRSSMSLLSLLSLSFFRSLTWVIGLGWMLAITPKSSHTRSRMYLLIHT
jgi:hypothetical protein